MPATEENFFVGFSSLCHTHPEVYLEYLKTVKHVASASLSRGFLLGTRGSYGDACGVGGGVSDASSMERRGRARGGRGDADGALCVLRPGVTAEFVRSGGAARCASTGPPTGRNGFEYDTGRTAHSDGGSVRVGARDIRFGEHRRTNGVVRGDARSGGGFPARVGDGSSAGRVECWRRGVVTNIRFGDAPRVDAGENTSARNRKWRQARKVRREAKVAPSGVKAQELRDTFVDRRIAENRLATQRALRALSRAEGQTDSNRKKKDDKQSDRPGATASPSIPDAGSTSTLVASAAPEVVEGAGAVESPEVDDVWSEASFDSRVDDATLPYVGYCRRDKKRDIPPTSSCRLPGQFPGDEALPHRGASEGTFVAANPEPRAQDRVEKKKEKTPKEIAMDRYLAEQAERSIRDMQEWAARVNAPRPAAPPPPAEASRPDATLFQRIGSYIESTEWGKRRKEEREAYERVFGPSRDRRARQAAEAEAARLEGRVYRPSFLEPSSV